MTKKSEDVHSFFFCPFLSHSGRDSWEAWLFGLWRWSLCWERQGPGWLKGTKAASVTAWIEAERHITPPRNHISWYVWPRNSFIMLYLFAPGLFLSLTHTRTYPFPTEAITFTLQRQRETLAVE